MVQKVILRVAAHDAPEPFLSGKPVKFPITVRVGGVRGGETKRVELELPDDHVVEVELENGITLWRTVETLAEDTPGTSRSDMGGVIVLPDKIPFDRASRSLSEVAVRLYRFFSFESAAKAAATEIAERFEDNLALADTLMHCPRPDKLVPVKWEIPAEREIVILLHGTFSSTEGSFGGLVQGEFPSDGRGGLDALTGRWGRLVRHFEDSVAGRTHIYGFEHRTLSKSPVQNAIDLLSSEQLPRGAKIHLLSHSRGGMVGELLARAGRVNAGEDPIDDLDLEILEKMRAKGGTVPPEGEAADYRRLSALLRDKAPEIRSFVRVAAPVQGTLLAARRLDSYLTIIANAVRLIPGPHLKVFEPLRLFIREMVGTRRDARVLPGLEAMMPDSPLVAILNRPDLTLASPLTVIGGDVEAAGILRALAVLATDLYFREDHDIVVNTQAMLGGLRRRKSDGIDAQLFLDRGGDVNHFNYFSNPSTADLIVGSLTGEIAPQDTLPLYADEADLELTTPTLGRGGGATGSRPVVFLLPGIMGTHLERDENRIWVSPTAMIFGGIGRIGAQHKARLAPNVQADGAVRRYYGRLVSDLERTHDVEIFDFDWRKSVMEEGERLAGRVRRALELTENSKQPIRIVAHSMGGLVARSFIAHDRAIWNRMTRERRGSRLLMLGTPNAGSHAIATGLIGRDSMIRMLERIDVTNDMREVIERIMPLPGVLELLATDDNFALFDANTWENWASIAPAKWKAPRQNWLDEARGVHERLRKDLEDHPDDVDFMAYIAGKANATAVGVEVVQGPRGPGARILGTSRGDGRVTWRSGRLQGLRTWFAPATVHGDLARDTTLFPAINDILLNGTTSHLPEFPAVSRGADDVFEMPEQIILHPAPDEIDLIGMGGTPQILIERKAGLGRWTRVSVTHGDLRYQSGTVAVGHYVGAPLVHAEKALDHALDGRLSQHRRLGLYPGELRTSDVFFGQDTPVGPNGALVIGLGQFGEMSREALISTTAQALLNYSLRWHERNEGAETAPGPCTLTTLLIGQRDSLLSISDSVRAVLEALLNANQRLAADNRDIRELRFLEVFEDTAVEAAEALRALGSDRRFAEYFSLDHRVRQGRGGRRRTGTRDETDWEQKIRIKCNKKKSALEFESLNRTALVPVEKSDVNWKRLDSLIQRSTDDTSTDSIAGSLIFEWLVPPKMKGRFSDGRNTTILVDPEAAVVPWELMHDRWRQSDEPIAVRANLMRQLVFKEEADRPVIAASSRVLIIGDPKSNFKPLPAAKKEAETVGNLFRKHGWAEEDVVVRVGESARVLEEISLEENQIFHFAGHGVQNWGEENLTGLVIEGGEVMEPAFVRTLRRMPEFVFLNCCHVGGVRRDARDGAVFEDGDVPLAAQRDRSRLAANLAVEFMRSGASAVIAAGWEVDDRAADLFASTFYSHLLDGTMFGDAVREARARTWEEYRAHDTWGAYQCYGDPQFRLGKGVAGVRSGPTSLRLVAVSQAIVALETVKLEAQATRSHRCAADLRSEFEMIEGEIRKHPDWQCDARLIEGLGAAAAELGDFDEAIRYYERAMLCTPPNFTAGMLEQLFELRVRRAVHAKDVAQIREAIDGLKSLASLGSSGEPAARQSRIGDAYLRLASLHAVKGDKAGSAKKTRAASKSKSTANALCDDRTCNGALHLARTAYEQAMSLADRRQVFDPRHAHLRRAVANYLISLDDPSDTQAADYVTEVLTLVSAFDFDTTGEATFEGLRLLAETKLFSLIADELASEEDAGKRQGAETSRAGIIGDFNAAFISRSSIRSRKEIVDDLWITADLLSLHRPEAARIVKELAHELQYAPQGARGG